MQIFCRLFKISDNIHEDVYSNDSENLDSNIGSVKIVQTEVNKGKSWKGSNSKQKPQYSACNILTASDTLFASEIREGIIKAPSFPVASQPHTVQGNFLLFSVDFMSTVSFVFLSIGKNTKIFFVFVCCHSMYNLLYCIFKPVIYCFIYSLSKKFIQILMK